MLDTWEGDWDSGNLTMKTIMVDRKREEAREMKKRLVEGHPRGYNQIRLHLAYGYACARLREQPSTVLTFCCQFLLSTDVREKTLENLMRNLMETRFSHNMIFCVTLLHPFEQDITWSLNYIYDKLAVKFGFPYSPTACLRPHNLVHVPTRLRPQGKCLHPQWSMSTPW